MICIQNGESDLFLHDLIFVKWGHHMSNGKYVNKGDWDYIGSRFRINLIIEWIKMSKDSKTKWYNDGIVAHFMLFTHVLAMQLEYETFK